MKFFTKDYRPLILLDFDGVINVLGLDDELSPWHDGIYGSAVTPNGTHGFMFSPTVASRLSAISEKADLRWFSTWGEDTPYFGVGMGMPKLKSVNEQGVSFSQQSRWWKLTRVEELARKNRHRKILWIDDEISTDENDEVLQWLTHTKDSVSFLRPLSLYGLNDKDLTRIEEFVA